MKGIPAVLKRRAAFLFHGHYLKTLLLSCLCIIGAMLTPSARAQSAPAGYSFCANEHGNCSFSGARKVAYGANGVFAYRTISNGTACDNTVFGDPAPNIVKACFIQNTGATGGAVSTPAGASSPVPTPAPGTAASTAPQGSPQLPPAPPAGLDPSKLPDILGVHIGTPTDQVIKQVAALYPFVRHGTGPMISGAIGNGFIKYAHTNDPPYISSTGYTKPNCGSLESCQANDRMDVIFSGPPEKAAVQLVRDLSWDRDNPSRDTLKSALIQKYGQNFTEYPALTLTWAFDEQGKALPPPNKSVTCQGPLSQQGYPGVAVAPGGPFKPSNNPQTLETYLGLVPVPPQQQQQQMTNFLRSRCSFILVRAQISATSDGIAHDMVITIQELPLDLRDAFAAERYLRQAVNAQSNQQLNNSQQQAAPKF